VTRTLRWRYYCDFCRKSGGSGGHIARHERGCTLNPNRVCGLHERMRERQPSMPELVNALEAHGEDWAAGMKDLRDLSENCPACILAAIRQSPKLQAIIASDEFDGVDFPTADFDFRKELASFWDSVRAGQARGDMADGYYGP